MPAPAFPVPSYFAPAPAPPVPPLAQRPPPLPSPTAAAAAPSATHQHSVRYSSKTLVLDHMLFLQLNARVRQLRRSSSTSSAAVSSGASTGSERMSGGPSSSADESTEVDRLEYGRRSTLTSSLAAGPRPPPSLARTASLSTHRLPSPIAEEEDDSAALEAKAAGYERMLSVLLERVRLSSSGGLSTPGLSESNVSSDEEEEDDDDDYIVSAPKEEAEDVLPEGVRLRLGLAGLVDVLARPEGEPHERNLVRSDAPAAPATPSAAQRQALALLEPLLPASAVTPPSRRRAAASPAAARAKAWFDAGVTDSTQTTPSSASSSLHTSRAPTPAPVAASSLGSKRGSAFSSFSTSGLGPVPDRWYDLARPSTTTAGGTWSPSCSPSLSGPKSTSPDGFASSDDPSAGPGRWVELLERFLLVSADLASAVGRSTIDEEERRRRARSSARGGVLRPLVARGGHGFTPAFGPSAGAGAAGGGWAARLGRAGPALTFATPVVVWESDSEESVDEADAERRAAGEAGGSDDESDDDDDDTNSDTPMDGPSAARSVSSHRARRISNPPSRSRSTSAGSTSSPPHRRSKSTSSAAASEGARSAAARPTRAWFALLAALVRQVVLSGFVESAWRGFDSAEAVLSIGCTTTRATTSGSDERGPSGRIGSGRSSYSSGTSASAAEAVGGGLEQAGLILFGSGGAEEAGGSKRRREFRRASRLTLQELTDISDDTPSLEAHLLALLDAHPLEEVEHAVLAYIEAAAGFLGTPELARQNSPAASAELTNASSGARRLPLSSLLNPTSSAPRSFPTYQQEPPTPPSDPNRAPRRRGLARWLVAPKPRRDGPAVAGVKRNRDGAEPAVDKGGRRRSIGGGGGGSSLSNGPGRPLMPTIVVEDWPDPYGV